MEKVIKPSLLSGDGTIATRSKNTFEEALDKLDLQGCLLLMTVLSEKALYLQSKDILDNPKNTIVKISAI